MATVAYSYDVGLLSYGCMGVLKGSENLKAAQLVSAPNPGVNADEAHRALIHRAGREETLLYTQALASSW